VLLESFYSGLKGKRGFTLVELLIVIILISIILAVATSLFFKWKQRNDVETSVRKLYAEIQHQRTRAFLEKMPITIRARGKEVEILTPASRTTLELSAPFSGTLTIDEKGIFDSGSIVFTGNLELSPAVSCVIANKVRLRLGKTVEEDGTRKCR